MATCITCGGKDGVCSCAPGESQGFVVAKPIRIGPKDFAAREIRISFTILTWNVRAWCRADKIEMPIFDYHVNRMREEIRAVMQEHFHGGGYDADEDKCLILQSVADKLRHLVTALELVDEKGDGLVVYTEWP
jgi:hypothetical protein